jgi:hypothetical protein
VHLPTNNSGLNNNSIYILTSGTNPFKVKYALVDLTTGTIAADLSTLHTNINASTSSNQISISGISVAS